MKCIVEDCPGKVSAHRAKIFGSIFTVKELIDHTCQLSEPLRQHRNVTFAYVANLITHLVETNVSVSPKMMMSEVINQVGYPVSYSKVRRAKQKVIETMYIIYEEAYNLVPRLLHQIAESNPGTYISKLDREDVGKGPNRFILDRVFWAFAQAIGGFKFCRPVLTMDGTFLTGRYKGIILTAVAVDANDQLLPMVFAIVESENTSNWLWFLKNVKMVVVGDWPNVCLITDRNAGLLAAINTIQRGMDSSHWWNDVQSRWCMSYLASNLFTRFRSQELMKMFKALCLQNQTRKFESIWRDLEHWTTRYTRESTLEGEQPSSAISFSEWINSHASELEKWSLLYDTDNARYVIMMTNMSEVYNNVLKDVRCLPITAIVQETWTRTVGYFVNRATAAKRQMDEGKQWSENMQRHMDRKMEKAQMHDIRVIDGLRRKYEIRLR